MLSFYDSLDFQTIFLMWFSIGIFSQSIFLLYGSTDLKNFFNVIGKSLLYSLFGWAPGKHEQVYNPYEHFWFVMIIYTCAYNVFCNKKILPTINEYTLLIFNIIFLYYFFHLINWDYLSAHAKLFLLIFFLVPSFFVLINAFIPGTISDITKLSLYIWYLLISAALLFMLYSPIILKIAVHDYYYSFSWITMLTMGMVTFCFIIDIANIALLTPISLSKTQTYSERLENIRAHINMLCSKFEDEKLNVMHTLAIVFLVLGALLANQFYLHFSALLVVNFVVLAQRYFYWDSKGVG